MVPQTVYSTIPNAIPFHRPQYPGPFIITTLTHLTATQTHSNTVQALETNVDKATQRATYNNTFMLYNEYQAVEIALRNQITDAVGTEYLSTLRNAVIDMIPSDVPTIVSFYKAHMGR